MAAETTIMDPLPNLSIGPLRSPLRKLKASYFVHAFEELVCVYKANKSDPAELDKYSRIRQEVGAIFIGLAESVVLRTPATEADLVANCKEWWGNLGKVSNIIMTGLSKEQFKRGIAIYTALNEFNAATELFSRPARVFLSDSVAAKRIKETALQHLNSMCPSLSTESLPGQLLSDFREAYEAVSLKTRLIDLQLSRPGLLGKAYTEQPVYWYGMRVA